MNEYKFDPFPVLETDRLMLRKIEQADAPLMLNYRSDKDNFEFSDMPIYTCIEEAEDYIRRLNKGVNNSKWIVWAISDKITDDILGSISIWNIAKDEFKAELGCELYPGNVGKGIMSEALSRVIDYGFADMGLKVLEGYTNIMNKKSIAMLEQNSFAKKSSFIETETPSGEPVEMVIYETRVEWNDFEEYIELDTPETFSFDQCMVYLGRSDIDACIR